jgi:hypothetical protein
MPDYSNGKIYKIVCNITGDVYIGSTCEPILARRLAGHVKSYKCWLNGKGNYVTSFKIIEQGNYDIVLIELFSCDTKDQLHSRESHYTQNIQCVNKIKNQGLCNTLGKIDYIKQYNVDNRENIQEYKKQYYVNNKEQIKQYNKQYIVDNRENIQEYKKQYREQHKEQSQQYREQHKDQRKQYRDQHKDQSKEYSKEYREQHKIKIKYRKNTVIYCVCGCSYTRSNKLQHERTNKHQEYLKNQIYYDIRRGLDIIKKLDNYFKV